MDIEQALAEHKKWLCDKGGQRANLLGADLRGADLLEADLRGANLRGANLRRADLRGANIDFSAWPLSCCSFGVRVDDRIVAQLFAHIARLDVSGCSPVVRYAHRLIFSKWPGKWLKNLFCEYRGDVSRM